MKKQLLAMVALLTAGMAQAQFEIGAKAGANYHFQSVSLGDRAPDNATAPEGDNGLGFHVGGFLQLGLSDNLYLRPEVLFSTRSWSSTTQSSISILGTTTELDLEARQTMSYVEVPVLLGLNVTNTFSI